ncbi:MAG: hypothetical protein U0900_02380 [Myxococcota bacterium]
MLRMPVGVALGVALGMGLLAPVVAEAAGFGGSLSYTRSQSKLDDVDDFWADLNTESDEVGIGLVFDTNLARNRLFNYRLNASLAFVDEEVGQAGVENQVQGTNVSLDQTFGFGFIRTPHVRVYVGPSLHLGVGRVDDNVHLNGFRENYERTSFTAGLGPELGFNFHVGRHLTFSTSAFVRYGFQVQSFQRLYDQGGSDGDFIGSDLRAGLVTSIFFRFGGDQFEAPGAGWGGGWGSD